MPGATVNPRANLRRSEGTALLVCAFGRTLPTADTLVGFYVIEAANCHYYFVPVNGTMELLEEV